MRWRSLPIPTDPRLFTTAVRLNSLGSLYFFEKFTLQRNRLSDHLHRPICESLEANRPRFLLELPRDHYKTVMVTEGFSIWRVLPFNAADEEMMRELGYDDQWIAWMHQIHNPARRILTVSEVLTNAVMIGHRFDWHFRENGLFRSVFPEILPDSSCTWKDESKQIKCPEHGPNGEGTFDFLGVGGALQSRHYHDVNEDDVVGKDAAESQIVMDKTIDYHKLLIGAFESYAAATWTVVNNRWTPNDLSGWIRDNQPEFQIEHHGALGGCCSKHPADEPIFPEEFSVKTLEEIRRVQGPYFFSHQFLNLPVNPEEAIFKPEWLRFYEPAPSPNKVGKHWLHHILRATQETIKDLDPNVLIRSMIVDPNHGLEKGRAHHAIVVTGFDPESDRVYLLDVWAKSTSLEELMAEIWKMAGVWGLPEFWLETVAAQRYLKYYIEYWNKNEKNEDGTARVKLTVRELKTDRGANAKRMRIESLEPLFREGRLWVREDQSEFKTEYYAYPGGRTVDVLDCMGYATQTWNAIHAKRILEMVHKRREKWQHGRSSRTGY